MPIFIDHTEAKSNTRLPESIISQSQILLGLESYTGADMLLSPLDSYKLDKVCDSIPSQMALRKHCQAGLLVQRKTGRDLTSSIPRLPEILERMKEWSDRPWLLFVGDIKCNRKGEIVIDGQDTNYSHNSLQGALDFWQLRGGYVTFLSRDSLMAPWCSQWLDRLRTWKPEIDMRPEQQKVNTPDEIIKQYPFIPVLVALPGIGYNLALRIAKYTGVGKNAMTFLTDPVSLTLTGKPRGWGEKRFEKVREVFGLEKNEVLVSWIGDRMFYTKELGENK